MVSKICGSEVSQICIAIVIIRQSIFFEGYKFREWTKQKLKFEETIFINLHFSSACNLWRQDFCMIIFGETNFAEVRNPRNPRNLQSLKKGALLYSMCVALCIYMVCSYIYSQLLGKHAVISYIVLLQNLLSQQNTLRL